MKRATPHSFVFLIACLLIIVGAGVPPAKAAAIDYYKFGRAYILTIDGVIEKGDYSKFIQKTSDAFRLATADFHQELEEIKRKEPAAYEYMKRTYGDLDGMVRIAVVLNSPGGDVPEAIQIGRAVKEMLIRTETGFETYNDRYRDTECMSACFFIWVSGVERRAITRSGKNSLGIHRLFFSQAQYKELSASQAEAEYKRIRETAELFLKEMDVPEQYSDRMFRVPSNDVYYLSAAEIDELEGKSPYYEELLYSRCGNYTKAEKQDYYDCVIGLQGGVAHRCGTLSTEYLNYVKKKINSTEDCWRDHDGIERWSRMSKFLSRYSRSGK